MKTDEMTTWLALRLLVGAALRQVRVARGPMSALAGYSDILGQIDADLSASMLSIESAIKENTVGSRECSNVDRPGPVGGSGCA